MRARTKITLNSKPALPRHVRLQFDKLRQKWALLAPEKVLWPDEISVDILNRCDGRQTVGAMVDELVREYKAERIQVEGDVIEALQSWSDQRLVKCEA